MKSLTTSIYTFEKLRTEEFVYVDKTATIYELIAKTQQYFLSRPRRFGKSLLISTLKAIFQGRRDLFDGLALANTGYKWQTYPVIHLDMGTCASGSVEDTTKSIREILNEQAATHGISLHNDSIASRFRELIQNVGQESKVVILIDEYDKPLLNHLGRETAQEVQDVLKHFYSVVKSTEEQQRFVLITGVSKFSKVSIFSNLNNLTDLTMSRDSATLLGYTQAEVETNFPDYIGQLARTLGMNTDQTLEELRVWYNGYKFHQDAPSVYNPVSLMKCFINCDFKNYWFETGTPTFLLDLLKRKPIDLGELTAFEDDFSQYEAEHLSALPLLFQTGYLTIHSAVKTGRRRQYQLGFPNFEIEESLSLALASSFAHLRDNEASSTLVHLLQALQEGDIDAMLERLKTFFYNVPYDCIEQKEKEKYYQTIFFTVFKLIGAMTQTEVKTSSGRIDAIVQTSTHIFLFEFKLNDSAENAIRQMRDKQYAAPYRDDPRTKLLVGVEFSHRSRNLERWLVSQA